jgi:hypothetical protein
MMRGQKGRGDWHRERVRALRRFPDDEGTEGKPFELTGWMIVRESFA